MTDSTWLHPLIIGGQRLNGSFPPKVAATAFDPIADIRSRRQLALMKQQTEVEAIAELKQHTVGNRAEIEASKYANCISCCESFAAKEVGWKDEWTSPEKRNRVKRWSGKCPYCGAPTVVGDASGILTQHYSVVMRNLLLRQKPRRR